MAIGGRTISELKASMSYQEFLRWVEFYKDFPFDDYSRIYRPAALISSCFVNSENLQASIKTKLEWLQKTQEIEETSEKFDGKFSEADLSVLRTMG